MNKKIVLSSLLRNIFILFLFFAVSFLINKIHYSYFIAHGDFIQFLYSKEDINNIFLVWQEKTQGSYKGEIVWAFFYLFQRVLYFIGFSSSVIANMIIFLFLVASFYSFYFSYRILNINFSESKRILFSLIYSLNIFTFAILTCSSGYSGFCLFYIFIPLVLAYYERILCDFSGYYLVIFCIVFFISLASFTNVAFFAAVLLIEILYLIFVLVTQNFSIFLLIFKRFLLIFFLQCFIIGFTIFPYLLTLLTYLPTIKSSIQVPNSFNLLLGTSYPIFQVITLSMSPDRYPFLSGIEDLIVGNNISISLYPGQSILKFLSFGYIAVLLVGLVFSDRNKLRNKIYYYFVFIVFFFLLMRLTPPFNIINEYIYRIPGFSIFRMPEKLFIFLPCIFLFFLIYLLNNSSLSKKVIYFLLIFLLIIPIPFYTGGISKFLTAKINSAYGFSYSYAIKLPDEYNSIRENIYYDKSITRVIELPYSDAVNWKIYPELGYVGHHMIYIENSLHSKSSVSADAADHVNLETRFSFKDYNDAGIVDTGQFLSIIQKFSGKYIILHKDVKTPYELKDSATFKTLEKMQQDKMITKLEDNRYISIYRLDDRYVYPMISAESHKIYFQKISPVKYKVIITGLRTVTDLGFNSSYDSQWKLYVDSISDDSIIKKENSIYYKSANVYEDNRNGKFFEPEDLTFLFKGSKFDNTHIMVKDYANSWEIDPEFIKENFPNDYYKVNEDGSISAEFTIYYKPQIYFETGFVAVVLVLAGMLVYLLVKQKKKSRTTIL